MEKRKKKKKNFKQWIYRKNHYRKDNNQKAEKNIDKLEGIQKFTLYAINNGRNSFTKTIYLGVCAQELSTISY